MGHEHEWKEISHLSECDCGIRTWLSKPPKTDNLTKYEVEVLELMPIGEWFMPFDLHRPVIHSEATCERLYCKGFLESRVVKKNNMLDRQFRFEPEPNKA